MKFNFIDNSGEVKRELEAAVERALEKCGLRGVKLAANLAPVDTGALRNSITHHVAEDESAVYIGSNKEYAAYVELGTGKYYPGGRPTPWTYQDASGDWHLTHGQRAQPYLKPAIADNASVYRSIIESELKGG